MICAFFEGYSRVGWICAGVRHYSWFTSDGRKDQSIDLSVGNPTPAKANFVTVSVSKFYLVSVSEFYLVSVPDIFYRRLCDFYMILNCVGTQNSIMVYNIASTTIVLLERVYSA